jgi:PEGA domain
VRPLTATLVLLSTLVVLLVSGSAAARPTGVVAPLNPLGIEAAEARRVQRWVTSAVIAVPGHRWLASSRLNKLLRSPRRRGCSAEPRCLGNLGRKIGAALVVGGDVGSLSGAYMVYLRLVGTNGVVVRTVNGVLDPRKPGLRNAARALAHQLLTPERYHGTIAVKVDVKNAWIYLDGQRTARSPAKPLTRVSVGTHALRVTHASYRDFVRFVKVGFGQTVGVDVALSAFPVRGASMEAVEQDLGQPLADHELPWYRRWWAVAGFGAVVLAATTATVAVLAGRSVGRDAEVLVRP